MKTLYLLRHAHAEQREGALADFDRPLDERGRSEAESVAAYLKSKKTTFDFVMCSAALRTQETLEPLRSVVGTTDIELSKTFYNIPEGHILECIQNVSDEREKILYIGHNPGVAFAILKFSKTFPTILEGKISPGSLVGFQFPIDQWVGLEWWQGEVKDIFQPPPPESPEPKES